MGKDDSEGKKQRKFVYKRISEEPVHVLHPLTACHL